MLVLVELEELDSDSLGDRVDSFLVISFALQEEDEVKNEEYKAKDGEEYPEG